MKKLAFLFVASFLLISVPSVFAADSTQVTLTGTAVQPDIDLKGSDILNAGTVNAGTVTAGGATVTGTVNANAVNANTVSSPSGTITTLNTDRVLVNRSATAGTDATNKAYVDANVTALLNRIETLESSSGGGGVVGSISLAWGSNPQNITIEYQSGITINVTLIKPSSYAMNVYKMTWPSQGAYLAVNAAGDCATSDPDGKTMYITPMLHNSSAYLAINSQKFNRRCKVFLIK